MNQAENKQIVKRQMDALNRRDLDAAVALVSANWVDHAAVAEAQGAAGLRRIFGKLILAFPDVQWKCEDMMAEGDRVICRMSMRGTNTGPLTFLRVPLPATGLPFDTESIHIFRLHGGVMVEHWAGRDDIGMFRQLGLHWVGKPSSSDGVKV